MQYTHTGLVLDSFCFILYQQKQTTITMAMMMTTHIAEADAAIMMVKSIPWYDSTATVVLSLTPENTKQCVLLQFVHSIFIFSYHFLYQKK